MEARHPLSPSRVVVLPTTSDVELRSFVADDVDELMALLGTNAAHLNAFSDHSVQVDAAAGAWLEEWAPQADGRVPAFDFAMVDVATGAIVGRIVLVDDGDSSYAVSAWVSADRARSGRTRAAGEALAAYAVRELGATALTAGVVHGNAASEGLLASAGFVPVRVHDTFTTYRLALTRT